jgi:5-methylcytosine-specific restriction protein B
LQAWAVKPGTLGFNGFAGQMLVNQLVKRSPDLDQLGSLLAECLTVPDNDAAAVDKLRLLVAHINDIRTGGQPAPANATFLLSYFWALADRRWPVQWPSAVNFAEFVTGATLPKPPDQRYREFAALVRDLDDDRDRFERLAAWWEDTSVVLVDRVLADRCAFGVDPGAHEHDDLARNAAALLAFARRARLLGKDVAKALGPGLQAGTPVLNWKDGRPRSDAWTDWTDGRSGPGIRVWVNQNGMAIGLKPGHVRPGWFDEAAAEIKAHPLPGFQIMDARGGAHGEAAGFIGGSNGEFLYGRWFDRDRLVTIDLREEVVSAAVAVEPVLEALRKLASGERVSRQEAHDRAALRPEADPLHSTVEEFRRWGYPRAADDKDCADQVYFASLLAPETLHAQDPRELAAIWGTRRYGNAGSHTALTAAVQDPRTFAQLLNAVDHLCYGPGEDEDRIDAVLTDRRWQVPGLGETVVMKLLAIAHPDRYLAVFGYDGDQGKKRMLQLLDLGVPAPSSRGRMHVEANDTLYARLELLFPGDPWGMSRFLLWLASRDATQPDGTVVELDPVADLAEELLLDRAFLDEIIDLLRDKGQVILYGPPGTGKTYIAKKLAEMLAPEPRRRSLVQFHPSTSYEDFVEGYRPRTVGGALTYTLTDGPLRTLADRARDAPGSRHLMVIDEINRGNLPTILGELLFLLEYRDERIDTLYRPDEAFELPPDLWLIGTMNTADRSIALVDAALRRRFHFVPIYPDTGPMEGLLGRWLSRHGEPAWVAKLVALVNDELVDVLGGPHLQIGPSHFMSRGLDEQRVERIWRYNIEPFVEDQLFGDQTRIDHFRFAAVWQRHREAAGAADGLL